MPDDEPILVIQKYDARRNPVSTQPESVLTGRTLEEIAQQ